MIRIEGHPQHYDWGSFTAIPGLLRMPPATEPLAELWFGSHPLGSATTGDGSRLVDLIAAEPDRFLGPSTRYAFGDELPFMAKLLGIAKPLSLQVHPSKQQAQAGFLAENALGIPQDDRRRIYHDWNHKPELLYAIGDFEALVGFSVRRQVRELLDGVDAPLAGRMMRRLRLATGRGLRPVVSWLLHPEDGPSAEEINEFAAACWQRLESGHSPAPLLDQTVKRLADFFPGDPGVAVGFLMNPVRLSGGEALYLAPRTLHSYQSGLALELLANSDNVIRAGLTSKHVDRQQLIEIGDFDAYPPTRIAPEFPTRRTSRFYSPVEDFLLTVVRLKDETTPLSSTGPRVVICLEGSPALMSREGEVQLDPGEALFITDAEGPVVASGNGRLAVCSVP